MSPALRVFQKGFNYSQDGPGNRLVYHLQGCNLLCPWCANPESIGRENPGAWEVPVSEMVREAIQCRRMFFEGGGVTFTGGEPTRQWAALRAALSALGEAGIHTAIETNALHPELPSLFDRIDCLMMDIKHHDPEAHRRITGVSNAGAIQNLSAALREHPQVIVRVPLVGGYNASGEDIRAFIRLFVSLAPGPNASFELLRYHEYGRHKWEELGMTYRVEAGDVSPQDHSTYETWFREAGLTVVRT